MQFSSSPQFFSMFFFFFYAIGTMFSDDVGCITVLEAQILENTKRLNKKPLCDCLTRNKREILLDSGKLYEIRSPKYPIVLYVKPLNKVLNIKNLN